MASKAFEFDLITRSMGFRIIDLTWSPNGRYLAYTTAPDSRQKFQIQIHDTKTKKTQALLKPLVGDFSPSFSLDGQYYRRPHYNILRLLGAEFQYQEKTKSYKITRIYKGDSWRPGYDSPFSAPAVQLREGDEIYKANGHGFQNAMDLDARLQSQNRVEIQITVKRQGKKKQENLTVKTLSQQGDLVYRDWVEANRKLVHQKSNGKLGYVHIPDMGAWGYAEFYRYFIEEFNHDGLVLDMRFNCGGHVSQHILKNISAKADGD